MTAGQDPDKWNAGEPTGQARFSVDARDATAVQVGDNTTQIIYTYDRRTWTDRAAPPPLVDVAGVIESPYRGLGAFEERDAAFFFGRDGAATELLELMSRRLAVPSLMVVSGVSGAGKSSLLRAGVLPRIRGVGLADAPGSMSWPCLVFTPGRTPLDQLAVRVASLAGVDATSVRQGLDVDPARFALNASQAALAEPYVPADEPVRRQQHRRMLLVVDQFEQVFTQCPDEGQRQAFIAALHAAASVGHGGEQAPAALVVLVVRADFEARCADYPQLTAAVRDRYLVTSMTQRQLQMAITEPAKKVASRVEDDLVGMLLREVQARAGGSPSANSRGGAVTAAGVLPLLSHALDQAWRCRVGPLLTVADYERAGGIERAIAESAQRAYVRLSPTQQAVARQVFIRLTATSSEGVDTADRVARTELVQGKGAAEAWDVQAVLESFAAERLLTLAAGTVEISHEVLLSAWPLLHDTWLAETHGDRIVRTRLRTTAAEWDRNRKDPSYLYAGSLLETAAATAGRATEPGRQPPLSHSEKEFLRASKRARRRRVRLRQSALAFLMVLVVGLAAVTVVAYRASQDAVHRRDAAVAGQLISQSQTLGDTDPTGAKLDSLAAWGISPSAEARYAMVAAAAHPLHSVLTTNTLAVTSVAFIANGEVLAAHSLDGITQLWDVATGDQIGQINNFPDLFWSVAFSPDGKIFATAGFDGMARLWDLATRRQIGQPLPVPAIDKVTFGADGRALATMSRDGTVQVWDVATRHQVGQPLVSGAGVLTPVAFSPHGEILAIGGIDEPVRLWDVATGHQTALSTSGLTSTIGQPLAFSPDGRILATVAIDGEVWLWDGATGHQIGQPVDIAAGGVSSVAFSADGTALAIASPDGTARLWDVVNGHQVGQPLTGPTGSVTSVAFSPDSRILATGSLDGTIRVWNVPTGQQVGQPLAGPAGSVDTVAFSPDGKVLAIASRDGTARLWDMAAGRQIGQPLAGLAKFENTVAFSPDGGVLATVGVGSTAKLWDAATGHDLGLPPTSGGGSVLSVAFGPDSRTFATVGVDGTPRLWDASTGRQIAQLASGASPAAAANLLVSSPDGKTLATAGLDKTVQLWNVPARRQNGKITAGTGPVSSVAFSPDSKTLATANLDGTAQLSDVATGQQIGRPLTAYTGALNSVAFSPDGKTLATAGADGTARLWDVATGQQIGQPLTTGTGSVNSVAFSPDGKTLVAGGNRDTPRLWNVGYLVDVLPQLCSQMGSSFTPEMWARYVSPGPAYRKVCP